MNTYLKRAITGLSLLAFTALGVQAAPKKAEMQAGAQTLVVNAKDALTGYAASDVTFVAYDPETADSISAGTTNTSGYTEILLTSPIVAVYQTTWGGIKSMFGENPQQATKGLEAKVQSMYDLPATPWTSVDVEGESVDYTKIRENVLTPSHEANAYNPWMIPDQTIAFPYQTITSEGALYVDKLIEMLKNITLTFSDGDQTLKGVHWPMDVIGWDPVTVPSDWTQAQIDNWKQSFQAAEADWESNVGYNLITLVPSGQTPTSQTILTVQYLPLGSSYERVRLDPAQAGYLVTGKIQIGAGIADALSASRLFYAEHVFGHSFGLNHVNDPAYLMYGSASDRTITPDEANLMKIIHNIAPVDMSKYPIPETD